MNTYSNSEKVDMLLIFGECRKNSREAAVLYRQRYPDRNQPSRTTFRNLEQQLRESGKLSDGKRNRRHVVTNDDTSAIVLAYFHANPHMSIRAVAAEMGISVGSVHTIMKKNNYHPFKLTLVQHLRPTDEIRRLEFIAWLVTVYEEDPCILDQIMWTDESKFTNNGVYNRHNQHFWSDENPHWTRERNFQVKIGINVWCGILDRYLIGPYFYEENLTKDRYLNFLDTQLPELMRNIPVDIRSIYFQQDGCPAHNARIVQNYLRDTFGNRVISTYGSVRWPARSPDLTPLDFFLWGYLQSIVYETPINNVQHLQEKIIAACATLDSNSLKAATHKNLLKRAEFCLAEGGKQFEQLLT